MANPGCPRCSCAVAIHEGRPHINADGSIQLWHLTCWVERDFPREPVKISATPSALPPQRARARRRWIVPVGTVATLIVIGVIEWLGTTPVQAITYVNAEPHTDEQVWLHGKTAAHDDSTPRMYRAESKLEVMYPIPFVKGVPMDELYPSLYHWIHPVTSAPELTTDNPQRAFGAGRAEIAARGDRPECGGGHCGIDLDGPRGRPVVAVAAGIVIRAEHALDGLDGLSGRYVRIQHDDGTMTAYMHLDEIAAGIHPGDRVDAGQVIGLLGMTAVKVPHLHFSLELPNHPHPIGEDTGDTHFVDPAPYLVRATIKPKPERHHDKPPS
jgi:murein DD-endopeptidase MepM/ murein hydrolase activator NlpD